mgnify:CR=1 FL=1
MSRERPPADYAGCPATVMDAEEAGRILVAPRWGLWDVVIGLGLAFALLVVYGTIAQLTGFMDDHLAMGILIGIALPWVGLAGWPVIATSRRGNGPRIDLGLRLTWSDARWGLLAGVVSLVLAGAVAAVLTYFNPDITSAAAAIGNELAESGGRVSVVIFALAVMVGAPVVEEIFFRGLLFAALRKRGLSALLTVLVTALAFTLFHMEPIRILILLPTGLALGWVRWKTGSTGSAMVAHGVVNAPGAIGLLLGLPGMTP